MNRSELEQRGFDGWISLLGADSSPAVPALPGVYAVAYHLGRPAAWPKVSCGGWYKGKDPTVSTARLEDEWIDGSDVIYIGKTDQTLRKRIKAFAGFGRGKAVAHQGGRLIWQLPDPQHLMIGWLVIEPSQATDEETKLLAEFEDRFGRLPFANLRH